MPYGGEKIFKKQVLFNLSEKGNLMLESLWRMSSSRSRSQFLRDAIVFYLRAGFPEKVQKFWSKEGVPEMQEFLKEQAKESRMDRIKALSSYYMQKRSAGGIKFSSPEDPTA